MLRRVFGPKRDEVTGEWRKLHNEELNDLYSLPSIVRVVKSRRMRWAGHVARMRGGQTCAQGSLRERGHWGNQDVDWRIILTHCGRVRQICVFNTVKLGTSASSP